MDNEKFARMLEKVKKLLNKAEDPACTMHEAEALNEKAAELVAKYGIEEAMLAKENPSKPEKIVSMKMRFHQPYASSKLSLAYIIATAFRCQSVSLMIWNYETNKKEKILHVIGYESDVRRADFLYTHLMLQAQTGVILSDLDKPFYENTKSWRTSWLQGFNVAVRKRLEKMEAKVVKEAETTTPGTALVVADRSALVAVAFKDLYPKTRTTYSAGSQGSGRGAGYDAGNRADIGHGRIGSNSKALGR